MFSQYRGVERFLQTNLRNPGPDRLIRLRLDKLARQFEIAGNKFEHVSRSVLDKHKALTAQVPQAGISCFILVVLRLYLNFDEGASSARLEPSDQLQQQQQQQLREPLLEDNQVPRPHDSPRSLLVPDLRTAGDWQLAFALANVAERNEEIVKLERRPALRPTATLHRAQYLHAWTRACFGSGPVCRSRPPYRFHAAIADPQGSRAASGRAARYPSRR